MPEVFKTKKDVPKTIERRGKKYTLMGAIIEDVATKESYELMNNLYRSESRIFPIFKNIIIGTKDSLQSTHVGSD